MGFESLKGAMLHIREQETTEIKGKDYNHEEWEDVIIGDLTEEEHDILIESYYGSC